MQKNLQKSENWDSASLEYARNANPFSTLYAFDLLTALLPVLTSNAECKILDVGCGAGSLALAYLRHFPEGIDGHIFMCTDLSGGMIEQARREVDAVKTESCKTKFEYAVENGTTLEGVADDSVDIVVSAFAIFMIPDTKAVLEQVCRVLRPGGMFGMTAWTGVPPLGPGFGLNFEEVMMASMGFLASQEKAKSEDEEDMAGPWDQWRDGEKGTVALCNAGFENVKVWKSMHTASFTDASKIWKMMVTSPMTDVSMFSEEELESRFNMFKASLLSKAGIDEVADGDDHMLLLVNASNLFVGRCK